MDEIIVGFSRPKNKFKIGSYLIRLWLQTNYSHVYIKFYLKSSDRTLIYEAVGSGVRFIGCTQGETHASEVKSFKLNISKDNYLSLLKFCVDNAGVNHNALQNYVANEHINHSTVNINAGVQHKLMLTLEYFRA